MLINMGWLVNKREGDTNYFKSNFARIEYFINLFNLIRYKIKLNSKYEGWNKYNIEYY